MSFKAKIHQIRWALPQTPLGDLTALPQGPDPLAGFKGSYFKGEGKERGKRGRGEGGAEWRERGKRGGEGEDWRGLPLTFPKS